MAAVFASLPTNAYFSYHIYTHSVITDVNKPTKNVYTNIYVMLTNML